MVASILPLWGGLLSFRDVQYKKGYNAVNILRQLYDVESDVQISSAFIDIGTSIQHDHQPPLLLLILLLLLLLCNSFLVPGMVQLEQVQHSFRGRAANRGLTAGTDNYKSEEIFLLFSD